MSSVQIRDVRKSFGGFEVLHGVSIPIEDGAAPDHIVICPAIDQNPVTTITQRLRSTIVRSNVIPYKYVAGRTGAGGNRAGPRDMNAVAIVPGDDVVGDSRNAGRAVDENPVELIRNGAARIVINANIIAVALRGPNVRICRAAGPKQVIGGIHPGDFDPILNVSRDDAFLDGIVTDIINKHPVQIVWSRPIMRRIRADTIVNDFVLSCRL